MLVDPPGRELPGVEGSKVMSRLHAVPTEMPLRTPSVSPFVFRSPEASIVIGVADCAASTTFAG